MEFFGASQLGYANPMKEALRCDYKEPSSDGAKVRTPVLSPELDIYHGQYDGRAYSSHDKLKRLRLKGSWHPQGPSQIYRTPITSAQSIGWFVGDKALRDSTWARTQTNHALITSEITRFMDEALRKDIFFMWK